ncbi:MAG: GAF domain-containing protein [Gammaproteobacteria bacterium]|nr:GAF domain-containing protein [Gammaproteobacteria bacterium]MDH5537143.1 GAF domain-containing protein [Betaproteobacteria bacterium]
MKAPVPADEAERIEELRQYHILDTEAESEYDDLVLLASRICGTPIALMSLVDAQRQWFKSRVGLDATETPRDLAFCAHAILQKDLMVVPDALEDKRFADNPLVTEDPNIRFYAGAPLITPAGHAMGTLCVIDRVPRTLDESQHEALEALGRQVVARLQLRRAKEQAEQDSKAKGELLANLRAEQERSERLLLSLFPKSIADRLKNEPPTCIAEEYSEVTILFASVHDFWHIAGSRPPEQFVELLNQVFSLFDRLADQHGVQKIKTIGDTYMAVCGLPAPRPDHAVRIAEMALSMQREIAAVETGAREPFRVRIGIHSGPAIAGVVGITKLAYDLWGPAVNLASQMESSGLAGGIQLSSATYGLLEDRYLCEPRGEFYVQGQGEILTYMLRGRRAG